MTQKSLENVITKRIEDLVPDIYRTMETGVEIPEDRVRAWGESFARMLAERLAPREEREFTLRMSNIGGPCARKLWIEKYHPEAKEKLDGPTYLKFLTGDIIEEVLLFLAEASGHTVEGRQGEQELAGIKGHRDAVIDGVTIDTKSASPFSFEKFKFGLTSDQDAFGYLPQLGGYVHSAKDDPIVTDKNRGAFLVQEKASGELCLDIHTFDPEVRWEDAYEARKTILADSETLPDRAFEDRPMGESGNRKLGTNCKYCHVKGKCWENLRAFQYSYGTEYLTKVKKEPKVEEISFGPNT